MQWHLLYWFSFDSHIKICPELTGQCFSNTAGSAKTIDELSYEVKQTVRHANDITADVQHKMKKIDPVMESVENLGEVLSEVTAAAKQVSTTLMTRFQTKSTKAEVGKTSESNQVTAPPATPERTVQSYEATYQDKTKGGKNWMSYIDLAANVWQRMRK